MSGTGNHSGSSAPYPVSNHLRLESHVASGLTPRTYTSREPPSRAPTVLAGLSHPAVSRDRSKKRPPTPDAGFRSSAPSLSSLTGKRLMRLSWLSYSPCGFSHPHIVGRCPPSEPRARARSTPHAGLGSSDLAGLSPDCPRGCGSYAPRGITPRFSRRAAKARDHHHQ